MKRSWERKSVSEVSIQYRSSETETCYETVGGERVSLKSLYGIGVQRQKRVMKRSGERVSLKSLYSIGVQRHKACYETVGGECL